MQVLASPLMSFADLNAGDMARVISVRDSRGLERLMEMGLTSGTEFKVQTVAPLGDTVEIHLRGYSLCLRKCEAEAIEVEILR